MWLVKIFAVRNWADEIAEINKLTVKIIVRIDYNLWKHEITVRNDKSIKQPRKGGAAGLSML